MSMGMLMAAMILLHLINLLSFRPVTPEFMRLNYVQQALISNRVSLAAFARR